MSADSQAGTTRSKILVVDNDPEFRHYLKTLLSKHGYYVLTTSTADDGLDALDRPLDDLEGRERSASDQLSLRRRVSPGQRVVRSDDHRVADSGCSW